MLMMVVRNRPVARTRLSFLPANQAQFKDNSALSGYASCCLDAVRTKVASEYVCLQCMVAELGPIDGCPFPPLG